ncbi:MAG: hypothetical protein RL323_2269 [Pseudomonadota bacterium]
MANAAQQTDRPFNLRRRFAITSLGVIFAIAIGLGWLLSSMLTDRMLRREGEVSMDFIQNLLATDQSGNFLRQPDDPDLRARFLGSMAHLSSMTEPVRANAYSANGTVVWSTDETLIGQRDADNDERDEALKGQLVVHSGKLGALSPDKAEHVGLTTPSNYYVESYIPVFLPGTSNVLGVVELYKVPLQLNTLIRQALLQLWLACAASALFIFLALNGMVARADRVMREQQTRLSEAQALSSAVELAGAVAHNLRNPLASIRSSAEMLDDPHIADSERQEHCDDIMSSVDRANRWITELVRVSNAPQLMLTAVEVAPLWHDCQQEMQPEMIRQSVTCHITDMPAPPVKANGPMLRQIALSILANAIEAMPNGGPIQVTWETSQGMLRMHVTDAGTGVSESARRALFRPFFSTKSGGLGIGLALARRTLKQWGGQIDLEPMQPLGSRVTLILPFAPHPSSTPHHGPDSGH